MFKAEIEVYHDGDKFHHFNLKNKNFRQLMKKALDMASSEKRLYEMLGYKVKVRVDWEQYDFEYDDEEGKFSSDQGMSFKQFLGIFDENLEGKARKFLEAHKDIFPGGESDDYCPTCGDQMYLDDRKKDSPVLKCDKCGYSKKVED